MSQEAADKQFFTHIRNSSSLPPNDETSTNVTANSMMSSGALKPLGSGMDKDFYLPPRVEGENIHM